MKERLISFLFLTFIAVSCMIMFFIALIIWLVTKLFDRRLVVLHYFTSLWAAMYVHVMPAWTLERKGRELIQDETYVVVSNHQSLLDILVAFTLLFPFKWVSKAEIFKVPFIGWNMFLNNYVGLKRGNRKSIEEMMTAAGKHLDNGSSVYMFPEGSRSEDGSVNNFKPGAFTLAKKHDVPILPIVINGTTRALPKHSLNFHGSHHISIEVLDPIPTSEIRDLDASKVAELVRGKISQRLVEIRGEEALASA